MPIYTYRCNDCGHEFEIRQRMSDDPLSDCPECDGHVRRVVNSVGVVFKGKGFYITDNRGGKAATLSANGKDATEKTDSGEKPAAETKEKKAETPKEKSATAAK